jgi:hypothetical protein
MEPRLAISRRLWLATFITTWAGSAIAGATNLGPPKKTFHAPERSLRRMMPAEFTKSIMGVKIQSESYELNPVEQTTELFDKGGQYTMYVGPLKMFGRYKRIGNTVCVVESVGVKVLRCRALYVGNEGHYFFRHAKSPDDVTGVGPIGYLRLMETGSVND